MFLLLRWLAVWLGAVAAAFCATAAPGPGREDFIIRYWTTADGLPQNQISCLEQTPDGYLWLGTWFGLARFDGVRFTVFTHANTPELVSDTINALAVDSQGTLWVATSKGMVCYRNHEFHEVELPAKIKGERVFRLAVEHCPELRPAGLQVQGKLPGPRKQESFGAGDRLWFQAGKYLGCYQGGKLLRMWEIPSGKEINSLLPKPDGGLYVFRKADCVWLAPELEEPRSVFAPDQVTGVDCHTAVAGSRPGTAWLGTSRGVRFLENGKCQRTVLKDGEVDALYLDRRGRLWANVRNACFGYLEGTEFQEVDLGPSVEKGCVECICEDKEGGIWAGTFSGLIQMRPRPVQTFAAKEDMAKNNAWTVCEATDGTVYLGTDNRLLQISSNHVQTRDCHSGYSPAFRSVWPRTEGGVWAIRADSIYAFNGNTFQVIFSKDPGTDGGPFNHLGEQVLPGRNGASRRLLVAMNDEVLGFDESAAKWDKPAARFAVEEARAMLQDREGALWFGTRGHGLVRIAGNSRQEFHVRDGLASENVWTICQDSEGVLWLGGDEGLTRYRDGKFFAFDKSQGLLETTVNCVLEDDAGCLWLSGQNGIYRVPRQELNLVAEGHAKAVSCLVLGMADGLDISETNGEGQPAGWKGHDGRLWFPTPRGVAAIDPRDFPREEYCPPAVIEEMKANEASIPHSAELETEVTAPQARIAPGGGQVVEIRFTCNSFVDPPRARFRYQLRGVDLGWCEATGERVARYINLHPGNYQFEVIAANAHNVWNWHPATLAFSITQFFWQTTSFYVICAAVLIGLATALQAYRLHWQRRLLKLEEQRSLANERARIARDLHDDLGTALTGLALELDVVGREARQEGREPANGAGDGGLAPPATANFAHRLEKTALRTRELAERMREVVWTVNPRCDTVSSLATFLEQQVSQFASNAGLRLHLDLPEDIPPLALSAEPRHQLSLCVREALNNVVRHSRASEVVLKLSLADKTLVVQIQDNGQGFPQCRTMGNGLANMQARMERLGGVFECKCSEGNGTTVSFQLPLRENSEA